MSIIFNIVGILLFLAIVALGIFVAIRTRRDDEFNDPNILASNITWGIVAAAAVGAIILTIGLFTGRKQAVAETTVVATDVPTSYSQFGTRTCPRTLTLADDI